MFEIANNHIEVKLSFFCKCPLPWSSQCFLVLLTSLGWLPLLVIVDDLQLPIYQIKLIKKVQQKN